jgi:pyruvate dehydrogenase E1 component alpha subunit
VEAALCAENPRWFPAEGEEATIVGSFYDLRPSDAAAPHYRGPFVVYLMRGAELWRLAAQAFGKAAGYNKGRSVPFNGPAELGIVPWVAGDLGTTLGVATGAALAFHYEGSDRVCVCTFGDGTANRGDFHESVNLAACWKLPVVYVCENNQYAQWTPQKDVTLVTDIANMAPAYGIPGVQVDGMDALAVYEAAGEAIARARRGEGPTLLECKTYRFHGHNFGDPQQYRSREEIAEWADRRDPIKRLAGYLKEAGLLTDTEDQAIQQRVAGEIQEAVRFAESSPYPTPDELLKDVYSYEYA